MHPRGQVVCCEVGHGRTGQRLASLDRQHRHRRRSGIERPRPIVGSRCFAHTAVTARHPFGAFLGLLPFVLAACSDATSSTDPRTQSPLVRLGTVERSVETERSFTGIVAARVQSDLGFRVPGKVLERLVDTGQAVKRGQPLMRIDPTDLRLAMRARGGRFRGQSTRAANRGRRSSIPQPRLRSCGVGVGVRPSDGRRRIRQSGAQCRGSAG